MISTLREKKEVMTMKNNRPDIDDLIFAEEEVTVSDR